MKRGGEVKGGEGGHFILGLSNQANYYGTGQRKVGRWLSGGGGGGSLPRPIGGGGAPFLTQAYGPQATHPCLPCQKQ